MMKNYYKILGISRSATQEQIKLAYRNLSKKHHPDVSGGNKESEKIFLEVQEAYKVLKDTTSREAYDARINEASQSGMHQDEPLNKTREKSTVKNQEFNMNDIEKNFEHFFGFNPKTKEMSSVNNNTKKKNPLDTSDLFERFFNK